ncbi:MAG TPA: PQQ-dependent sugar dehydrogenase [Burkholderiaceae bacterium]|nr:PQQ-dependent sugar dehydrogenase [Burkholderiaceae bacterium]
MKWLRRLVPTVAVAAAAGAAQGAEYATKGMCGDFPRVDLQVPPGHCVALVVGPGEGLRFPRRILEVAPDRFWIIDMGSWEPRRGRLLEMTLQGGHAALRVLADKLDRPLGLVKGPDGRIYVGEAGSIWRTPVGDVIARETVIDHLPDDGAHPLKELAFGTNGHLFVNIGSSTDACRDERGEQASPCADLTGALPRAAVYEAVLDGPDRALTAFKPYATGLRNSLALTAVPGSEILLQGENSIDYAAANDPREELNVLLAGRHYGWPYCVGARQPARGYQGRFDCMRSEAPLRLWPAHVAPLQMIIVPTLASKALGGQLLVAWHGYRAGGHRVVGFALDKKGRPQGAPKTWIGGWNFAVGIRPLGAPTGIAVDHAGRLWVVEDRNRTVLVMQPDS